MTWLKMRLMCKILVFHIIKLNIHILSFKMNELIFSNVNLKSCTLNTYVSIVVDICNMDNVLTTILSFDHC